MRSPSKSLDFLIIGAQKAGTTTLFKLLSEHPGVAMPPGKELPFFNNDDAYFAGLPAYLREFYGNAAPNALWGKATPHYLCDFRVSERIAATVPQVKLVAILRDPAERALSHYRMSVRRGLEKRSFEQAIDEMLKPVSLQASRELPSGRESENQTYIVWGEYGRLLRPYFDRFKKDQILVLFTEDLNADPERVMQNLSEFLGLPHISFASLGKKYHEGGRRERLPWIRTWAYLKWVRMVWHKVPKRTRSPLTYWFHQYNILKEHDCLANYNQALVGRLRGHFQRDIYDLEQLLDRKTPW